MEQEYPRRITGSRRVERWQGPSGRSYATREEVEDEMLVKAPVSIEKDSWLKDAAGVLIQLGGLAIGLAFLGALAFGGMWLLPLLFGGMSKSAVILSVLLFCILLAIVLR